MLSSQALFLPDDLYYYECPLSASPLVYEELLSSKEVNNHSHRCCVIIERRKNDAFICALQSIIFVFEGIEHSEKQHVIKVS
jgi:hypothetical protein